VFVFQKVAWGDNPKENPEAIEKAQKKRLKGVFQDLQISIGIWKKKCDGEGLKPDIFRIGAVEKNISPRLEKDGLLPHNEGWQAPEPKSTWFEKMAADLGVDSHGSLFNYEYIVAAYLAIVNYYETNAPWLLEGIKHSAIMQEFIGQRASKLNKESKSEFV